MAGSPQTTASGDEAAGRSCATRVGATAWTNIGSISSDDSAWLESPLGRAMQKAVAELVKRINVEAVRVAK